MPRAMFSVATNEGRKRCVMSPSPVTAAPPPAEDFR
jgi:hypothetical protein